MPIFKKPNLNQNKNFSKTNPLLGFRLVYLNSIEINTEATLTSLKQTKEGLEMNLESEMDLKKRAQIKDEIKATEKEIKRIGSIEPEKTPVALLQGLESNIKDIDEQINAESDIANRQTLEAKKIACLNSLESRQRKIKNHEDVVDAIDQVNNDSFILKSLEQRGFDHVHVEYLLSSDLAPFFDERFKGQLETAKEQMITSDFTKNALNPQRDQIVIETDSEWAGQQEKIQGEISKLEAEKGDLGRQLSQRMLHISKKSELKRRVEWIDNQMPNLQNQLNDRSNWTHGRITEKERELSKVSLLEDISPDILDKMKTLLQEARFMRMEKIREHLTDKYGELTDKLDKKEKEDIFGKSTMKEIRKDLKEFKTLLIDQKQDDPEKLKKLIRNMNNADMQLNMSIEELEEIKKNRPQIEQEVLEGFSEVNDLVKNQLKPEVLQRLRDQLSQDEAKRKQAIRDNNTKNSKTKYDEENEVSSIFKKANSAIKEFEDPKSELNEDLERIEINLQRISEMEPEELQGFRQDLAMMKPKIQILQNLSENMDKVLSAENNDAINAHQTIIEIEKARDAEEIKHIINRNLGPDHFAIVSSAEFNSKYKKFAPEGFMAFYQREDELGNILSWSVIVDETALHDPNNLREIKKQLTHEILHLEFEKNPGIKDEIRKNFVETDDWPKIRKTFLEKVNAEGKKPPSKEGWTDDDILSELYAMQKEIGNVWREGDDVNTRLNNLLVGAGLANGFNDITEKARGYEKAFGKTVEKVRGAESMDAGGDLGGVETSGAAGSAEEFTNRLETEIKRINELQGSEFIGYVPGASKVLKIYKEMHVNISNLNKDFEKNPENTIMAAAIDDGIGDIKGGIDEVEGELGKASAMTPNLEINPIRKLWNNTNFICANDMVQMLIDFKEFISRRHNRKKGDHAARLGMAVFQNTDAGRDAYAKLQKAEMEEVQEWQTRYENLDAWELLDEVKAMANKIDPSKDQLKAILRLLAQKGRIDWRNPYLWKILNKLQGSVHLRPDDPVLLHNPPVMRQKLHTALGEVFDYDEFLSLERQNESGYDGEMRKYLPSYDRMQDQLTERLDQLLRMHRNGQKVDPMEYESIMVYSIEKGKSFAENVMFHLMVGMADGLLTQDRGLALDKYLNEWPATQWIYSKSPPLSRQDYIDYCNKYFKHDYEKGTISDSSVGGANAGKEFKNFYWVHVQNDMMTIQRVRKSVSERKWDHDWTRSIACMGDANTAKRFFAGKSGQQETKDTGVENTYAGAIQWLEENAVDPNRINYRYHFARQAGFLAMSEGIMDRVAYYRGDNDISTRANESMENSQAREQPVTNHKDWKLRDNRAKVKSFLDMLDPEIFAILRSKKDLREEEDKKEIGLMIKEILMKRFPSRATEWETIQQVDDVYEKMDLVIQVIFESMSDAQLKYIIDAQKA